jgi:hypothetical protein
MTTLMVKCHSLVARTSFASLDGDNLVTVHQLATGPNIDSSIFQSQMFEFLTLTEFLGEELVIGKS